MFGIVGIHREFVIAGDGMAQGNKVAKNDGLVGL